jgi:hypothetical protein
VYSVLDIRNVEALITSIQHPTALTEVDHNFGYRNGIPILNEVYNSIESQAVAFPPKAFGGTSVEINPASPMMQESRALSTSPLFTRALEFELSTRIPY